IGGGTPTLGIPGGRSEQTTWAQLGDGDPDLVVIAPCGYGLAGAAELAATAAAAGWLPDGVPVWAVDADAAFVRPGPRLVDGVEALAGICHPEVRSARPDLVALV
ncbi:MAG: cobalamin-binding protein, partial [Acidimicrobiales bacterium]